VIDVPPTVGRVLSEWTLEPLPLTVLALAAVLYLAGVARVRTCWPWPRAVSFHAGLFVIALAIFSGIDAYDDTLLSVHMVQHILLLDVAPPLLVLGAPIRLAFASMPRDGRMRLARVLRSRVVGALTVPAVGLSVYAAVLLGTHFTGLYELALRNETVHRCEHVAYVIAGLLFFAPIVAADPLPHRPGPVARLVLFTFAMLAMVVPGAWLTFTHTIRYPFYIAPARVLHDSVLADQQLAGMIMIVGGGLTMLTLKLALFLRDVLAEERREQRRESYIAPAPAPAVFPEPATATEALAAEMIPAGRA